MNETYVPKSVGLLLARKVASMLFTDEIDFEMLQAMDIHENEKASISLSVTHTHIVSWYYARLFWNKIDIKPLMFIKFSVYEQYIVWLSAYNSYPYWNLVGGVLSSILLRSTI